MINQKIWIKSHKKAFANNFIKQSGAIPDDNPSAIFMAGLPGSGKTEFTKRLISNSNLKVLRLDMDEIATNIEGYKPDIADKFRAGASELLNKVFDVTLAKKYDFIMDGTFSSKYAINNVRRALKHNYNIRLIYIIQEPKTAWEFTLAREKVEHRAIELQGFINSYFGTIDNIKNIMLENSEHITLDIIIKNKDNREGVRHINININDIDKYVKPYYNEESLKEYLTDGR